MLKAQANRYVIKLHEQETTTSSGIIVKSSGDTQLAVIVFAGEEVKNPLPLGTKIAVDWNLVVPIKLKNEQFFIVKEDGVLGTIDL